MRLRQQGRLAEAEEAMLRGALTGDLHGQREGIPDRDGRREGAWTICLCRPWQEQQ